MTQHALPHVAPLRPLVIRFGALGDMVILLSLVRALHRRFRSPVDVVSSGAWTRALLERQPGIGTVHLIRSRKMPYLLSSDQWRLVRALRARAAGPMWDCDGDKNTRRLLARAGIPASHVVDAGRIGRLPDEHELDRMLRLGASAPEAFASRCPAAQIDPDLSTPPLALSDSDGLEADAWLSSQGLLHKPLVLIQAGNKRTTKWWRRRARESNTKHWPEIRWAHVIDHLAALEPGAEFLLCGVASESALNTAIIRHVRTARVRNVAGDLPLARLFALQERAVGMISVDTGPAHSAAALGTPLLVLFGTADPTRYTPRSKTGEITCLRGFEQGVPSIIAITAEEVVSAWISLRAMSNCRKIGAQAPVLSKASVYNTVGHNASTQRA